MARPLRIQFPGALYHVISRGNAKQDIFLDDGDRHQFLCALSDTAERLNWRILVYCLMTNHYHLCIETVEPTLARGMRDLNGRYAQGFNYRHERVGHLFQGRYKGILVERPGYLLELARYIVLNPVRAGLSANATQWPWSSHRAVLGLAKPIRRLAVGFLLAQFEADAERARTGYEAFIAAQAETADEACGDRSSPHPVATASAAFIRRTLSEAPAVPEVPRAERASRSLSAFAQEFSRDEAIRHAYASGTYSLAQIGRHFGLNYSTVSRICRQAGVRS